MQVDPTQLELAVLNLAMNARDAMPQGGSLIISTRQVAIDASDVDLASGDYVELAVVDSGIGMPTEILARAVEPFFTTKGVGAGTGLGLSMAFGVATQSNGTLRIRSTVGEGTSVQLLLPCTQARSAGPLALHTPADIAPDALSGLRIAVVDDDPDVRQFVVDCLASHGAACEPFDGGEAFLARFETALVDIVFVDFAMPGMTGAEVARRTRQIDPKVPVVIMTGYADSAALDQFLGDVDVIRKPFTTEALLTVVKQLPTGR